LRVSLNLEFKDDGIKTMKIEISRSSTCRWGNWT
jgi:hypothetical protein